MALKAKLSSLTMLVLLASGWVDLCAYAQVMPHRASPICRGQCGTPLTGPCTTEMPYAYVPTRWRRWPVVQASATEMPEEIQTPTPAKPPTTDELPPASTVPELPMTPDLPEPTPGPGAQPSTPLTPPFGEAPAAPPFGDKPQVPVFGDEPQAPPSAAGPSASPFSDEPPQPPADVEQPPLGPESTPGELPPAGPGEAAPATAPTEAPGARPDSGMPFDVGPPEMPSDDPFKDDPNQSESMEPKSGASTQGQRRNLELAQAGGAQVLPVTSEDASNAQAPRLLRADGSSLDATKLPSEAVDSNPLRQVSHPVRRTSATQAPLQQPRPSSVWRRNPLRGE